MPRAADMPSFVLADHPAPTKTNPLGVKGCGEAGCAGALDLGDERGDGRARRLRHPPSRHAADAGHSLAGAAGRQEANGADAIAMTEAVSVRTIAAGRVAADRRRLRGASDEPLLHAHAGAALGLRARRFQCELYELALALTVFNVVSAVLQTPVGFLVDRVGARVVLIAGLALCSARLCGAGPVAIPIGSSSPCTASPASATPSIIRRTIRCCRITRRRTG